MDINDPLQGKLDFMRSQQVQVLYNRPYGCVVYPQMLLQYVV